MKIDKTSENYQKAYARGYRFGHSVLGPVLLFVLIVAASALVTHLVTR